MLKRGLLFLLVFIIFLEISFAQDSCLVASEENVPIISQRILNIYSQLNLPEGITPQQAVIDSINRWQPSGNIDPNWINFKSNIINAISIFPAVPDNTQVSLPEDFSVIKNRAKKELKCNGITSEQREAYFIGISKMLYRAIEPRGFRDISTILQRFIPQLFYGRDFISEKLKEIRAKYSQRRKELVGEKHYGELNESESKEMGLLYEEMVEELKNLGIFAEELSYVNQKDYYYYYLIEGQIFISSSVTHPALDDAWRLYLGLPQQHETFSISEYRPSKSIENKYYFNLKNFRKDILNDNNGIGDLKSIVEYIKSEYIGNHPIVLDGFLVLPADIVDEELSSDVMGSFTLSLGNDENGYYLSYYDIWDLEGEKFGIEGEEGFFGKPFEIYDRIYYDPVTFEILPREPEEEILCE